jgi:hypothetical protein
VAAAHNLVGGATREFRAHKILFFRERREAGGDVELVEDCRVVAQRLDGGSDVFEEGVEDGFFFGADAEADVVDAFAETGPFLLEPSVLPQQ